MHSDGSRQREIPIKSPYTSDGIFIVLDPAAERGSGLRDTDTLHRIDEAEVKKEVEAAGFKLVAESAILHNPADTHKVAVLDPSIRGKTDQFILKFRKPR